ncbi:MAG: hypothetical protein KatS3mg115_1394 [Candidatus Poribacteria bacterium]|nr:MAG: hypothetical protein KatS3mg115_1394 [Candidatus Poribacteria bacterium]
MSRPYPRPARPEDEEALRECVGRVFRPSLYDEYPQLFHAGNLPHCRVIELDGKIVSHVGLTIQDASILGCAVRVGCIGAVATLPEYRGKGYASACLIDAMLHARAQGCDWLIISGDRSLYRRVGARRVGRDFHVRMSAEQAEGLRDPKVHLRRASREDIPLLMELHQREPVHWKRSVRVWGRAFDCAFVMNRPASFWIVERAGIPQGYLILQEVREPGRGPHR